MQSSIKKSPKDIFKHVVAIMATASFLSLAIMFFTSSIANAVDISVTASVAPQAGGGGGSSDTTPPVISNVAVNVLDSANAEIAWNTDENANSFVDYGLTPAYELGTVSSSAYVLAHSLALSSLNPGALYHFRVRSIDALGNAAGSIDATFTTPPLVDALPANVSNLVVANIPNQPALQLSWTNPADPDFAGTIIRARTDVFPSDHNDGRLVYDGQLISIQDSGLTPGVTYYYSLFAYDAGGNHATGTLGQGTVPTASVFAIRTRPEKRIPSSGNWEVSGAVDLRAPGTTAAVESLSLDIPDSGDLLVMTTVFPGRFDVAFKGLGYLRSTLANFDLAGSGSTADFSRGGSSVLLGGDVHISNDNIVNALDVSAMLSKLGTGFVTTDLNRDGLVNSLDVSVLLSNLSKRGNE